MNLPSPEEQLDLHGPRAQLPFEQTSRQSRAGLKSSHDSLEQDKALIVSKGIITSGGTQNYQPTSQEDLVSPVPSGQSRPDGAVERNSTSLLANDALEKDAFLVCPVHAANSSSSRPTEEQDKDQQQHQDEKLKSPSSPFAPSTPSVLTRTAAEPMTTMDGSSVDNDTPTTTASNKKENQHGRHGEGQLSANSTSWLSRWAIPWRNKEAPSSLRPAASSHSPSHLTITTMQSRAESAPTNEPLAASHRRPMNTANGSSTVNRFGTLEGIAQDANGSPPTKPTRFQNLATMFKRFMGFVGPGYIISVGYMDPGNWATDLAGGSSFGYMLLFIILLSNLMAVVLQGLAVKLGVVSGLDLAQACRKFAPKYVNWVLYVLAELAIIACDLAEVIGSAIALNLLFKIPLPWGVVITAADVLVILFAFRDEQSVKSRRLFEALVILLVSSVGICFTAEIVYAQPVATDVLRGFLPSTEILTNKEALYLAIGIIGATVMPHNLYLHSSIVKLRTSRELNKLASSQTSMSSTSNLMTADQRQTMLDEDKGAVSLKHSTIRTTLRYTFWDSTVALTFALYVNSAILIVSAATFKYKFPEVDNEGLADFFDAFHLLSQYLGKAAGYVFAVALLMAGQSSTLTATLAGQIIMEGFLGASYLKPWVRRLLTRCLAIIPALVIVILKGQNGLSGLLLASQVALSIQLPFAVIPLVLFTSMGRCMTIPVQDNHDKPGELNYGFQYEGDTKVISPGGAGAATAAAATGENVSSAEEPQENGSMTTVISPTCDEEYHAESTAMNPNADIGQEAGSLLLHNFANPWWLVIISGVISIILLGLNFYLLVQTISGN